MSAVDDGLRVVSRDGGAVPFGYTVSETGTLTVTSAHATFSGAAASGAYLPCLSFYAQNGVLLGRYFPDSGAVAAGSDADVSYGPFLGGAAPAATAGTPSLPQAFAGRISSDETLTKNATTTITFDSLTTNAATVFTGLDGASQVVSVASSGVYLVWARIEFNVVNDGNHELLVVASATPTASAMSRVVKSDLAGQDQRFSKDTFYPLTLASYQLVTTGGNTGQFSLQFVSTGASINATGRGRLHMIRLGDLMV